MSFFKQQKCLRFSFSLMTVVSQISCDLSLYERSLKTQLPFGSPCEGGNISSSFSPIFKCSHLSFLSCIDGFCQCGSPEQMIYSKDVKISCSPLEVSDLHLQSTKCSGSSCPSAQYCSEKGVCTCPDSNMKIDSDCYDLQYLDPMSNGSCEVVKDAARFCDYRQLSFCKNSKCVCYKPYFYNFTSEACENKIESPLYRNGSYQAMPEEYCLEKSNCVTGLHCRSNFTCACPGTCKYVKKYQICDCGKVQYAVPSGPKFVGVFLSFISFAFWIFFIRRTYKEAKMLKNQAQQPSTPQVDFCQPYNEQFETGFNNTTNMQNIDSFDHSKNADLPPPYSTIEKSRPPFNANGSDPKGGAPIGFTYPSCPAHGTLPYSVTPGTAPPYPTNS